MKRRPLTLAISTLLFSASAPCFANDDVDSIPCVNGPEHQISVIGELNSQLASTLAQCYEVEYQNELVDNESFQSAKTDPSLQSSDLLFVGNDLLSQIKLDRSKRKNSLPQIKEQLKKGIKILVEGQHSDALSEVVGISLTSAKYVLVEQRDNRFYIDSFGEKFESGNDTESLTSKKIVRKSRYSEAKTTDPVEEYSLLRQPTEQTDSDVFQTILKIASQKRQIKTSTDSEMMNAAAISDLPSNQVRYYTINNHRRTAQIDGSFSQKFDNDLAYDVVIAASYKPFKKYVQISTRGGGFNPTSGKNMAVNVLRDKGFFHNKIEIILNALNGSFRPHDHKPLNVNNQTTHRYTTGFSVGVDVAKEPSFNASYEVAKSVTQTVSDFQILDSTSYNKAYWTYQLGLTRNNFYDIFEAGSGGFDVDTVARLPPLATSNLSPRVTAIWSIDGNATGRYPFEIGWKAQYGRAYAVGNIFSWTNYKQLRDFGWGNFSGNPIQVDLSVVKS